MFNLLATSPDDALKQGITLLQERGQRVESRNGDTLEAPRPCCTEWIFPTDRVSFDPARDANPFFHLFESLWILAGRQDVRFLDIFNKRMKNYSDNGVTFHAPYGYRIDGQLEKVINLLYQKPESRRAVLQIWDWRKDLATDSLDIPCNDMVFFKIRRGRLNMTICCRSNDMLWGAYGANVVQFSMLQEYIASSLNIPVGTMFQISDSLHVYTNGPGGELWQKLTQTNRADDASYHDVQSAPLVDDIYNENIEDFNEDLFNFFERFDALLKNDEATGRGTQARKLWPITQKQFETRFFEHIVRPMLEAWIAHKSNMKLPALITLEAKLKHDARFRDNDWITAGYNWMKRRYNNTGA